MQSDNVIKNIKLFLFDMDGTLYLGEQLFEKEHLQISLRCAGAGGRRF